MQQNPAGADHCEEVETGVMTAICAAANTLSVKQAVVGRTLLAWSDTCTAYHNCCQPLETLPAVPWQQVASSWTQWSLHQLCQQLLPWQL
jgi:hypothetical protein